MVKKHNLLQREERDTRVSPWMDGYDDTSDVINSVAEEH